MLQIYNSLTKKKETFQPIQAGKVGIYVCGMTVYDLCHIGHARVMVNFDVVARFFRYRGFDVNYVRNITDIDDKIINRANENQEPYTDLTKRVITAMHEDAAQLGVQPPDQEPCATAYIDEIISMIEALIEKGLAYVGDNHDVYYRVSEFAKYGQLAHKKLDELLVGARVEVTEAKQNPLDFVLWKAAKPNEPNWGSPWGAGRPGWHIECSAMSTHCLGNHFDIHGGGFDLKFPHHENEIAQAVGATGEQFVNYWMHVGFVTINQEKMSKSLGNFFTIREVLEKYNPEVIRYFMVSSHYRSPVNYSQASLDIARGALERFYTTLRDLPKGEAPSGSEQEQHFIAAMEDDFNTPEALAVLFDITHEINRLRESDLTQAANLGALLSQLANVLGLLYQSPEDFLQSKEALTQEQQQQIEALIQSRTQARAEKNWAKADEYRDKLNELGIELEDKPSGTVWRRC